MNVIINHLRSSIGLYGAEQVVLELCAHQRSSHPETRLLVFAANDGPAPDLLQEASRRGLKAERLPCAAAFDPLCLMHLRRRLKRDCQSGAVILHCHDYKSVFYGALAALGLPVVKVATLHGWLEGTGRLRLYHWLEIRMLRHFRRVCAVSPLIVNELLDQGLDAALIRRVNNGIDTNRYRPRAQWRNPDRARFLRIGTASRLSPEKNLGLLITAVGECRDRGLEIHLDIVGDGPLRAELAAQAESLGLGSRVCFHGRRERLEDWYPRLDAFVLPSRREGMPISVLEALACGCPVIASNVGSVHELLDGIAGCKVVAPNDLGALVEALMTIRWTPGPLLEARDRVSGRYSSTHMATSYAGIYREALAT